MLCDCENITESLVVSLTTEIRYWGQRCPTFSCQERMQSRTLSVASAEDCEVTLADNCTPWLFRWAPLPLAGQGVRPSRCAPGRPSAASAQPPLHHARPNCEEGGDLGTHTSILLTECHSPPHAHVFNMHKPQMGFSEGRTWRWQFCCHLQFLYCPATTPLEQYL